MVEARPLPSLDLLTRLSHARELAKERFGCFLEHRFAIKRDDPPVFHWKLSPLPSTRRRLHRIVKAWPPLREFVFFSVDRAVSNFPAELRPDLTMPRDRDCVAAE